MVKISLFWVLVAPDTLINDLEDNVAINVSFPAVGIVILSN